MANRNRSGARCYTLHNIMTPKGPLPRDSHGTVRYESENLGRHLVFVDWDNGIDVVVFAHEIEILEQEPAYA